MPTLVSMYAQWRVGCEGRGVDTSLMMGAMDRMGRVHAHMGECVHIYCEIACMDA